MRAAYEGLITHAWESAPRAGAMVSRIAQLVLVDCLFLGVAPLGYEQTIDALKRTRDVSHPVRRGSPSRRECCVFVLQRAAPT